MVCDPAARKIIHIDMDAFFAAIEERDNPELAGKPVIVGGMPARRGVVATCNYVARAFGIASAMPASRAVKLCPQAVFIKPRFEAYRTVSHQLLEIFHGYTDLVEPSSLDEGYLDVTAYTLAHRCSATALAREIKAQIRKRTRLSASAGVSYNKFLAKIASDINKPDGLYTIRPEQGKAFAARLPVIRFHGVGKATAAHMHRLGIGFGRDLQRWSKHGLIAEFGKTGAYYHHVAFGIDERPVVSSRVRKSVGSEITFETDLTDFHAMLTALRQRARKVAAMLVRREMTAQTVTVKVKFSDFQQITRRHTLPQPLRGLRELQAWLPELLQKSLTVKKPVRLLGVTVSNLHRAGTGKLPQQMDLLDGRAQAKVAGAASALTEEE